MTDWDGGRARSDSDVLQAQLDSCEALSAGEQAVSVVLDTERPDAAEYLTRAVTARLDTGRG